MTLREKRSSRMLGMAISICPSRYPRLGPPDADFFDLGGDSLTAVRLLVKIEDQLGEEIIEPDLIFTTTRFGDLAEAIAGALRSRDEVGGRNDSQ